MNTHTVILPYTPEPIKRLIEFKKRIEDKIRNGEDIDQEIKKITHGSKEIPNGLRNLKRKNENI